MKSRIIIYCLLTLLVATHCKTEKKNIIKQGNWTIENPERYKFVYKTIGSYDFGPTLTVGSNGVMLSVQVESNDPTAGNINGNNLEAKINSDRGELSQLDKPGSGDLMTILEVPFAVWYIGPPKDGSNITSIDVIHNGSTATWDFIDGDKLQE
ncbi:MAG: hypothetical protein JW731_03660 [Bacteroidales bacterium]|nr:hypothetical protein [Bacteroidales bacterium]